MTCAVNIYKDKFDVYIGRRGKGQDGYYGNPVPLDQCKDREGCMSQYETYFIKRISEDIDFAARIEQLRGQRLGCFCMPKLCHGMVIVRYLEGTSFEEQIRLYNQPNELPDNDTGTITFD